MLKVRYASLALIFLPCVAACAADRSDVAAAMVSGLSPLSGDERPDGIKNVMTASVASDEPVRMTSGPAPSPLWTALLSAAAALAGAMVGFWSTRASSRAAIVQKTNELEIESIDRKLSQFVGPFIQLSEENRTLAQELKRGSAAPPDFRTLTALLTPGWRDGLSKGDANLLEAVVGNGVELRRLLMDKGAAMVSPQLLPYFSTASTHFRFLQLAYAGSLDPEPSRYGSYVYPRELDKIMDAERIRLESRRELLRSEPHRSHPRMPDLVIPSAASLGHE